MQFGTEPPPARLISLTPLIDVVFILLVFFMLASSFLDWRAVDMRVSAAGGAARQAGDALVIEIKADGTLVLNGRAMPADDLARRVEAGVAEDPDKTVIIRPELGVPLQSTVDVLDLLRAAGALEVSLARPR